MEDTFTEGQVVEHCLTKEWVMVLSYDKPKRVYTCRTKKFEKVDFFDFELKERNSK